MATRIAMVRTSRNVARVPIPIHIRVFGEAGSRQPSVAAVSSAARREMRRAS